MEKFARSSLREAAVMLRSASGLKPWYWVSLRFLRSESERVRVVMPSTPSKRRVLKAESWIGERKALNERVLA